MKNIKFDYQNSLITQEEINNTANSIKDHVVYMASVAKDNNYNTPEASINLAFDKKILTEVKKVAKEKGTKDLKYIIVCGVGGSNLGTKAIYEAIYGRYDAFSCGKMPKIIFLDTVCARSIDDVKNIVNYEIKNSSEILLCVISKSGSTTEPIANFEVINKFLSEKFENFNERIVAIANYKSKMYKVAKEKGISVLDIHENIGGRYSVFCAVGLLPLALAKIDIDELLEGVRDMRDRCINEDVLKNPALISACLIYLHNKKGCNIVNSFFFNPELESAGKWYRQLMGESIGKKYNTKGEEVYVGITPITSIGSTDLHSMAQLFWGGPRDKFTNIVYSEQVDGVNIPDNLELPDLVENLNNKSFKKIMNAILGGTLIAYKKNRLPYVEVEIPEINEYTLGQYLQFKMMEMMYLAKLLGVNAFDQPSVEDYKSETRELMKQ